MISAPASPHSAICGFYFDILKIDGQFVRGIADNADNQVLTAALASIADHFDMVTVAESVENARDAAFSDIDGAGNACKATISGPRPYAAPGFITTKSTRFCSLRHCSRCRAAAAEL